MNNVLETLRAIGPKAELIRVRGAELSQCWVVYGGTQKFSMGEVREGEKSGLLVIDGDRVRMNPENRKREISERRSEGARKAAETVRNEPLSPNAVRLLRDLDWAGGRAKYGIFDRRMADELSRKGYAHKVDIREQLGANLWGDFRGLQITARGTNFVRGEVTA